MKRIILIIILSVAYLSSPAQGFKGIIDIYGGISPTKGVDGGRIQNYNYLDFRPLVAFGLNVAEGYQINKMLFAGIGFGGYTVLDKYSVVGYWDGYSSEYGETNFPAIMLPIFADVRWTLDVERKVTPFVDLKIGYQFRVALSDGNISWNYGNQENFYLQGVSGFYFQPTVGFRFGRGSAFNLGITYNATINQKLYQGYGNKNLIPVKDIKGGALMLSLGADF